VSPDDIAACLRVLAALAEQPDEAGLATVAQAVDRAYRAGKKQRKVRRRAASREHDRDLVAGARRYREAIPSPHESTAAVAPLGVLRGHRRCYICKDDYSQIDFEYHMLCPHCAAENLSRRHARCDLTNRRAIVTGGRVKIGFHTAVKLLRDGADVLVTTRFPRDAARRYAALPDSEQWRDRLWVHGVDFLDLTGVLGLLAAIRDQWDGLDILVNNAAQTIQRPPDFHREVRAAEALPLGAAAAIATTGSCARPAIARSPVPSIVEYFPAGAQDETGEPLDLRATNSWTLRVGDVTPREWLEAHIVSAFVPFLLTGQLRPLLAASPFSDRYVVQVSAMEGSFSRVNKTPRHPHTNMAKAGLNMLTRTVAAEYATDGIYMTSVDTGWVTDERPHPAKNYQRAVGFRPPLDVIDGAARVYDPIVRGVGGERLHGVFLKDYRSVQW
jgi:NAD(P)-dependent dehydrogenase (short-subunit alcohol dehydrogenase family)